MTGYGRGAVRLVVVDDYEDMRLILSRFALADGRFELVGEATDGRQAVQVVGATQPDVVVLDVHMPAMDGIEAIPHLRAVSPDTRIVMYSAHSERVDEAFALGAHAWHGKGDPVPAVLDSAALSVNGSSPVTET